MEALRNYYCGSYDDKPIGTVLKGHGEKYVSDWEDDFRSLVESFRPKGAFLHQDSVVMTGVSVFDNQEVAIQGIKDDSEEFFYASRVLPIGSVQARDLNWLAQADAEWKANGVTENFIELISTYYSGEISSQPVCEYLTPKAEVLDCQPYERLEGAGLIKTNADSFIFIVSREQIFWCFIDNQMRHFVLRTTMEESDRRDTERYVVEARQSQQGLALVSAAIINLKKMKVDGLCGDVPSVCLSVAENYLQSLSKSK